MLAAGVAGGGALTYVLRRPRLAVATALVAPAVLVALFIAAAKASLVAMFFMHLKGERPIIFWSLAVTAAFFVFLFALPMWTEGDHIVGTRPDAWSAGAAAPHAPAHSPGPH